MADTDQFVRTVASITREDRGPQTHAYDAPGLSPIEFLQAVYRDPLLPMSIRIDAARGLLPFVEPRLARIPSEHSKRFHTSQTIGGTHWGRAARLVRA